MFLLPNFGIDINSPKSYIGQALVLVMVLKMFMVLSPFSVIYSTPVKNRSGRLNTEMTSQALALC